MEWVGWRNIGEGLCEPLGFGLKRKERPQKASSCRGQGNSGDNWISGAVESYGSAFSLLAALRCNGLELKRGIDQVGNSDTAKSLKRNVRRGWSVASPGVVGWGEGRLQLAFCFSDRDETSGLGLGNKVWRSKGYLPGSLTSLTLCFKAQYIVIILDGNKDWITFMFGLVWDFFFTSDYFCRDIKIE